MDETTQALIRTQQATIRNLRRELGEKEQANNVVWRRLHAVTAENVRLEARVLELLGANNNYVTENRRLIADHAAQNAQRDENMRLLGRKLDNISHNIEQHLPKDVLKRLTWPKIIDGGEKGVSAIVERPAATPAKPK